VYRLAESLRDPARAEIQEQTKAYVRAVINVEWPLLARGQESPDALRHLDRLSQAVGAYEPSGERESALYAKLLDELQDVGDERRMRILASREGIPALIWVLLIGGGIVTVLFTYFFGLKSLRAQLMMTALYVAAIGFVLFLIAAVDYPYSGAVRVEPRPMELVLERIELIESDRR
jgi:hypothetical protein